MKSQRYEKEDNGSDYKIINAKSHYYCTTRIVNKATTIYFYSIRRRKGNVIICLCGPHTLLLISFQCTYLLPQKKKRLLFENNFVTTRDFCNKTCP